MIGIKWEVLAFISRLTWMLQLYHDYKKKKSSRLSFRPRQGNFLYYQYNDFMTIYHIIKRTCHPGGLGEMCSQHDDPPIATGLFMEIIDTNMHLLNFFTMLHGERFRTLIKKCPNWDRVRDAPRSLNSNNQALNL